MSKTWETLFHLSSFMKYLLAEVLPKENSCCPQYLMDSLFELLSVTLDCIQVVKDNKPNNFSTRRDIIHSQIENLAIEKSKEFSDNSSDSFPVKYLQKSNEQPDTNINTNVSRIPENGSKPDYNSRSQKVQDVQYPHPPKHKKVNELALKLFSAESKSGLVRHQSVILSKNFLFLNEQVSSGDEVFGSFCVPCDKSFFHPNDWGNHLNHDAQHANIKPTCEELYCTKCNFVVYGTLSFAPVYLDFHSKTHVECAPPVQDKQLQDENLINQHKNKNNSTLIKHTKFYCGDCGKKYISVNDWVKHLTNKHNKEIDESDYNFMESSASTGYNETNLKTSKNICGSEDTLSSVSISSRSEFYNTQNKRNLDSQASSRQGERYSKTPGQKEETYVISQTFMDLNSRIHNECITKSYYCRPCDTFCFHKSEWSKHWLKEKHIFFMKNPKFKNIEVICDYCNLVFIGSIRQVKEYMRYHSTGHGKVPSYSMNEINDEKNYSIRSSEVKYMNRKGKGGGKRLNKNKEKNLCNEDDYSQNEEGNEIPNPQPPARRKATVSTPDTNTNSSTNSLLEAENPSESNWFTASRDEEIMSTLKKMCLDRKKLLVSGFTPHFGGFCLLCDKIIEDAFDWMDHCGEEEHCSRVGKEDKEIVFNEVNVTVFGNQLHLKDFVP